MFSLGGKRGGARRTLTAASGAEGSRTPDLSVANAALSQLSYGPVIVRARGRLPQRGPPNGRDRTRTCDLHDVNVAL